MSEVHLSAVNNSSNSNPLHRHRLPLVVFLLALHIFLINKSSNRNPLNHHILPSFVLLRGLHTLLVNNSTNSNHLPRHNLPTMGTVLAPHPLPMSSNNSNHLPCPSLGLMAFQLKLHNFSVNSIRNSNHLPHRSACWILLLLELQISAIISCHSRSSNCLFALASPMRTLTFLQTLCLLTLTNVSSQLPVFQGGFHSRRLMENCHL